MNITQGICINLVGRMKQGSKLVNLKLRSCRKCILKFKISRIQFNIISIIMNLVKMRHSMYKFQEKYVVKIARTKLE